MTISRMFSNISSSKILEYDKFNILGLENFNKGEKLLLEIIHSNNGKDIIKLNHTYNKNQIEWFKAGSALNLIANQK